MACAGEVEGVSNRYPLVVDRRGMCVDGRQSYKAKELSIVCHVEEKDEIGRVGKWRMSG